MKPQTSAATIHNPRITIHATTSASLSTFNILFKNKDDQFRAGAMGQHSGKAECLNELERTNQHGCKRERPGG